MEMEYKQKARSAKTVNLHELRAFVAALDGANGDTAIKTKASVGGWMLEVSADPMVAVKRKPIQVGE